VLSEKNKGFHNDNGVIVEMDAAGKLAVPGADWPFKGGPLGMPGTPYAAHGMRIAPAAGHPRTRIQRVAPQRR
jgi:hypothetical protein